MKNNLEVSNMTREQRAKEHFKHTPFSGIYKEVNKQDVYIQYCDGDWMESLLDNKNQVIYKNVCFKVDNAISFTNIITCK